MDTPNSNDNGLSSDFEGEDVQTQADGKENASREGDYAINWQCPQCFNPIQTDSFDVMKNGEEIGIAQCVDFCAVCGWFGLTYYE